jgi:hypothetical protein
MASPPDSGPQGRADAASSSWQPDAGWRADAWQADTWTSEPDGSRPVAVDATALQPETSAPAPPDAAPPPPAPDAGAANTCAAPTCGIDGQGNCGCSATANGQGYFLDCQNDGQCECLTGNSGNDNQNNAFFDDQACFSEATIQGLFMQACQCP